MVVGQHGANFNYSTVLVGSLIYNNNILQANHSYIWEGNF